MKPFPPNSYRAKFIRGLGLLLTSSSGIVAALSFLAFFGEEMSERHPVNAGKGILAPMCRHWIEMIIVDFSTMSAVATAYYCLFGPMIGAAVNWTGARRYMFPFHFVGGCLLIASILIAIITQESMHFREATLTAIGFVMLTPAIWEWVGRQKNRLLT
jgi:hypothetical protein